MIGCSTLFSGISQLIKTQAYLPNSRTRMLSSILQIVLGFFGLKKPDVAGATLSWPIGPGIISSGVSYLIALCGISRIEKHVKQFRADIIAAIDEQ